MTRRDLLRATVGVLVAPVVALLPRAKAQPEEVWGISYWLERGPNGHLQYPHWRNYTGTYSNIDKDELLRKMKAAKSKMVFNPPFRNKPV
jgi:hypothetical protein